MDIICFHNPDEDNGYLSNWYPSPFTVDDIAFSSMEQFMMYRKAICFGDEAVALKSYQQVMLPKSNHLVGRYQTTMKVCGTAFVKL